MKIGNVEKTHQYLKYHASLILALQGKDVESRMKFRDSLNGFVPDKSTLSIFSSAEPPAHR